MKNAPTQSRPVGARRLRRFSACMVLDGRKVQPGWALKRPQGRAPVVLVNSTSEFGLKEEQGWPFHVVPMAALDCLNRVCLTDSGPAKDQFLPLLLAAAEDPRVEVRMNTVLCLGHYREQSNLVIPVLTNALENPYPEVRIRAAMALHRVDPVAAQKARVADVAYECLKINVASGLGTHDSPHLARQFLLVLGKAPDQ